MVRKFCETISGGSRGGPPCFSDQTEAWRAEKNVCWRPGPSYLRVWMTPPPLPFPQQFWRSGSITDNAVHVCDTDEFYLYSHSSFVGFNLLHETSWLYLFGSTEGSWLVQWLLFFSVLGAWLPQCQSLLFLPVDKKDGFINDVKHLLKYLCLHRGPLEMYGISSKLYPWAQLFEGWLALTWG